MKKDVIEKISAEISRLYHLAEEESNAAVNKTIKLIKQNGYTIVSNKKRDE